MNHYFPVFFDMEGKNIRVYGGGKIAARRIKILLEFGANVRVSAPQIAEELEDLAQQEERLSLDYRAYQSGELGKEDFVFAATGNEEADNAIYRECRHRSIPVNLASDKEKCDFYFPGVVRDGDITVGVTSGGKDHQKVAEVTERIREQVLCRK